MYIYTCIHLYSLTLFLSWISHFMPNMVLKIKHLITQFFFAWPLKFQLLVQVLQY